MSGANDDMVAQLERLKNLKDAGGLDEAEYAAAKASVLGKGAAPAVAATAIPAAATPAPGVVEGSTPEYTIVSVRVSSGMELGVSLHDVHPVTKAASPPTISGVVKGSPCETLVKPYVHYIASINGNSCEAKTKAEVVTMVTTITGGLDVTFKELPQMTFTVKVPFQGGTVGYTLPAIFLHDNAVPPTVKMVGTDYKDSLMPNAHYIESINGTSCASMNGRAILPLIESFKEQGVDLDIKFHRNLMYANHTAGGSAEEVCCCCRGSAAYYNGQSYNGSGYRYNGSGFGYGGGSYGYSGGSHYGGGGCSGGGGGCSGGGGGCGGGGGGCGGGGGGCGGAAPQSQEMLR